MDMIIGHETLEVSIIERGTYRPPNSKASLKRIRVGFTISGPNALERYSELEAYARSRGVVFDNTLWTQSTYDSEWSELTLNEEKQAWHKAIWTLKEMPR
jgi:hypothetical protein